MYKLQLSMRREILKIVSIITAIILMPSCGTSDRCAMMGEYHTHYMEDHVAFSDMDCSIELDMEETFGRTMVKNKSNLALTFHFVSPFEFPSMTLEYEIEANGKWELNEDTLSVVLADKIDDIKFKYIRSNASTPTEESMVRNIRSMLSKDIKEAKKNPEKSAFILRYCNSKAIIKEYGESEIKISPIEKPDILIVKQKKQ